MAEGLDIVNLAKAAWAIVEDGKPSASAKSAYCQAMPPAKDLPWDQLAGWKTKSFGWSYVMYTQFDKLFGLDPTINIDFAGQFDYGGTGKKAPGAFLNNFTVYCKKCDVDWGWTVDVDATMQGMPKNVGSTAKPVASLQLRVALTYKSKLQSRGVQWAITADGNGALASA